MCLHYFHYKVTKIIMCIYDFFRATGNFSVTFHEKIIMKNSTNEVLFLFTFLLGKPEGNMCNGEEKRELPFLSYCHNTSLQKF